MPNRAADWFAQAAVDLQHARHSREVGDFEWACFAAQQVAEKAVEAVYLHLGGEGWGHSVSRLLKDLAERLPAAEVLLERAKRFDRHYIPTRYPNGFDVGTPREDYTRRDADEAIADAESILELCRPSLG